MALTRIQSVFTYESSSGGQSYYFDIVVDPFSGTAVRNVRTPTGPTCDPYTSLPEQVVEDIQTAIGQAEDLVAQTSAINGILTFAAETYKDITFTTAMSTTSYRVHVEVEDFIEWRIVNKATTGFRIELNVTYTGDVGYDVFV